MAEGGGQRAEGRGQRAEGRGWRAEDRGRRAEAELRRTAPSSVRFLLEVDALLDVGFALCFPLLGFFFIN
jgi:hypothetical protein